MPLTNLQICLSDIFKRIIINAEPFDPEQETHDFLIQAGQAPEAETNQRYLQLIRTLRHDDFNIRSTAAKFLCIICYQNFPLQRSLRTMLPLTILASNLLVFNLPVFYDASMLSNLQKNVNVSSKTSSTGNVFWYFPMHYITDESLLFTEPMESEIEDMLKLNVDPLYQFIGSVTIPESIQQPRTKPGSLERRLTAHFSTPITGPSEANRRMSGARRLTVRRDDQDKVMQTARPFEPETMGPEQITEQSEDTSDNSTPLCTTDKSELKTSSPSLEHIKGIFYKPSTPELEKATPKFQEEVRSFWMPDGYAGEGSRRYDRKQSIRKTQNQTPNKSVSQAETGIPLSSRSSFVNMSKRLKSTKSNTTLLDLLEITPTGVEARSRLVKKNKSVILSNDILSEINPEEESKNDTVTRSRSVSNPRVQRVTTKDFIKQTMKEFCSEMSRETFRLLKQDRHDMYADYDEHVERLGLRPFAAQNFKKTSFDPENILKKKMLESKPDRKQAFLDFLNEGHREKYAKEQPLQERVVEEAYEGIKANTYYGRKWKNELSRVRLSNFGKKENFAMYASPTILFGRPSKRKERLSGVHKKGVEKVMDRLKLDVASSNEKFVSNIVGTNELAEKVYGEDFKKYLDVLNYERANYNGVDPQGIEKACELVDVIYDAKQRSASTTARRPADPVYNGIGGFTRKKEPFVDEVYQKPAKEVPRSKLFLRHDSEEDSPYGQGARIANIGKMILLKKKHLARKKKEATHRSGYNYHPNHNMITETTDLSAPPHILDTQSNKMSGSTVGSQNSLRG